MKKLVYIFLFLGLLKITALASDTTKLRVGDKAPAIVLPTVINTLQSFSFPYKSKMFLVYFWASSVQESKENLYRLAKINKLYSQVGYKEGDGFEVITIAIQSDRNEWNKDIAKYNMSKMNNCIAVKGYNDSYIKDYKISELPTSYLIDQYGKIAYINPDMRTIQGYLENKRNTPASFTNQNKISGKILYGEEDVKPLQNQKIYVTNANNDTIQTVSTTTAGNFSINNINAESNVSLKVAKTNDMSDNDKVYLASENGEIVSNFKKTNGGFEYRLLDIDMTFLKPMKEETVTMKVTKELSEMYFSENLFKSGATNISPEATAKLDLLIDQLKADNSIRVEIISHTDSKGDAKQNLNLSNKRANTIAKYFIAKGIAKTRIKCIGKGETEPVNKCVDGVKCTESEYEENRRAEFKFYKTE